ncbi:uncharacterized protein BDZ83DRAFT_603485 [Colletotrichum acutatum]|uniref:Uncharacterized protein n=1 Tax=Glomerella acutata TaxID=27357 RepID=A0AAD8XMJ9_GLOAC|nr:uncharacterized protein BDZ83DRAFT_603485 [Colletotrichum acutatum]KAK1730202.1 hypothetical protein BDZ83DRAFT_603485 [Colletotrichum acutatum]
MLLFVSMDSLPQPCVIAGHSLSTNTAPTVTLPHPRVFRYLLIQYRVAVRGLKQGTTPKTWHSSPKPNNIESLPIGWSWLRMVVACRAAIALDETGRIPSF